MQLKGRGKRAAREIGTQLAAATCALLGHGVPSAVHAQELAPWDIDTSMLIYNESDGRVRDVSVTARARKELRVDEFVECQIPRMDRFAVRAMHARERGPLRTAVALRFDVLGKMQRVARRADDHADRNLNREDFMQQN